MRKTKTDIKLLAAGAGMGGLICAAIVSQPAAHVCVIVAAIGACAAFAIHKFTE